MARRYDYDYNFDPEGTPEIKPDPYTEEPPPPAPGFLNAVTTVSTPANFRPHHQRKPSPEPHKTRSSPKPRSRSSTPATKPAPPTEPSKEYLSISSEPSLRLDEPKSQRKLLVLDLNGTLVYRSPHQRRNVYQQHANGPRPLRSVHQRPYLASFREYVFHPDVKQWLDTIVWSSAQPHSVADMVQKTFGSSEGLVAVWARDTLGLSEEAYHRKTQTTKDLEKPWAALGHSARTTFLLDDSPLKAHLQPWNHLCIREYVAEMRLNDVKVRDAEILRERKEQYEREVLSPPPTNEDEDVAATSTSTAMAPRDDETEADDPNLSEESKKRKRDRRKDKKERKKAEKLATLTSEELHPVDAQGRLLEYDQTLLAVIGVLDMVKHEDNIAGWMRGGGLARSAVQSREESPVGPLTKRRRLLDEAEVQESPQSPTLASSKHDEEEEKPFDDVTVKSASGAQVPPEASTTVPLDMNLWFEDRDAFRYWADRGRKALDELGIEVRSGIIGSIS